MSPVYAILNMSTNTRLANMSRLDEDFIFKCNLK
jgi:hypothetical protein